MSLEYAGEDQLTKIYYKVVKSNDPAILDATKLTETEIITGNQLTNKLIANNLEASLDYKVYYQVENSYGSKSDIKNELIYKYNAEKRKAIKNIQTTPITVPTLMDDGNKEFKWNLDDTYESEAVKCTAVLYNESGKVIAKKSGINHEYKIAKVDFTNNMKKAGKYYIGVIVEGDATHAPADEVNSGMVEVLQLEKITEPLFKIEDDGTMKLTWKDTKNQATNLKEYTITLEEYDKEKKTYKTSEKTVDAVSISSSLVTETTLVSSTNIDGNTSYKATIKAKAKDNQYKVISSEGETSASFYFIGISDTDKTDIEKAIKDITSDSLTIDLADTNVKTKFDFSKIDGANPTYTVEAYEVNKMQQPAGAGETEVVSPTPATGITTTLNGDKLVVGGLKSNQKYQLKLTVKICERTATVKDIAKHGASANQDIVTLGKIPEITNLKVVDTEVKAKNVTGTIFSDGSKLYINGVDVSTSAATAPEFGEIKTLVQGLSEEDVITIAKDAITIDFKGGEDTVSLGTLAHGKKVILNGKVDTKQTITSTNSTGVASEVILNTADSIFDTTNLYAEKITLNTDVDVKGNKTYTLPSATREAVINGIAVTTDDEVVISATGKTLNVNVNSGTNGNNMTFANLNDSRYTGTDATINFVGKSTNDSVHTGTIKITSETGKVTVTQEKVNVTEMNLVVEVKDASVEVADKAFTGSKTITINTTTAGKTVTVVSELEAIGAMKNIELKTYTDKEIQDLLDAVGGEGKITYSGEKTTEVVTKVRNFLNAFDLNEIGAKVSVEEDDLNTVTITFTQAVNKSVTVKGLLSK